MARPFARQTWADGIDETGRPILRENLAPTADGTFLYPGPWGATNWWSPSFSPATGLLYVPVVEWGAVYFSEPGNPVHVPGRRIWGSAYQVVPGDNPRKFIRALAHESGNVVWEHEFSPGPRSQSMSGILSTGGGLVFSGAPDGRFVALDAHTGKQLWERPLGGNIIAAPITYIAGGQQHIAIAAGRSIVAFALHR